MSRHATTVMVIAMILMPQLAGAQARYTAKQTGDIVQLHDARTDMTVSVITTIGSVYEIVVKGRNITQTRYTSVADFRARPGLNGIPLLAPFANRLDQQAFYANGKKYNFDMELGNVRGAIPIHGFMTASPEWKMVEAKADATGAWVTNKLEFFKVPAYMKQFPFAHTLTMTYRVSDGALEVRTRIDNLSNEPMPIAIGFHPSFWLTDSTRDEWTVSIPAKTHWLLDNSKVPTGETEPIEKMFPDPHAIPLTDKVLDDVFSDLERDAQGRATARVTGKGGQKVEVTLDKNFRSLVVWSTLPAPAGGRAGGGGGGGNRGGGAGQAPAAGAPAGAAGAAPARAGGPPPAPAADPNLPNPPLTGKEDGPIPPNRGFIAFEPMAGITNSMNAAQKGTYKELQTIPPGGNWTASFWVRGS